MKVVVIIDDETLRVHGKVLKNEIYDVIRVEERYSKKRGNHASYYIENVNGIEIKLYENEVRTIKFKNDNK